MYTTTAHDTIHETPCSKYMQLMDAKRLAEYAKAHPEDKEEHVVNAVKNYEEYLQEYIERNIKIECQYLNDSAKSKLTKIFLRVVLNGYARSIRMQDGSWGYWIEAELEGGCMDDWCKHAMIVNLILESELEKEFGKRPYYFPVVKAFDKNNKEKPDFGGYDPFIPRHTFLTQERVYGDIPCDRHYILVNISFPDPINSLA